MQQASTSPDLLAKAISAHQAGDLDEAETIYRNLLVAYPKHANILNLLGTICAQRGNLEEGIQWLEKAIAISPNYTEAHYNKGLAMQMLGRYRDALKAYEKAIAIDPKYFDAIWHKCLLHLTLGEYEEGWKLYEWRWKKWNIRNLQKPLWLGRESLVGKTILLHAEQGLGDNIQFCRYAPMVETLGARVILEIPASLAELFSTLKGKIVIKTQGEALPEFDMHCPLASLPLAFQTSLNTIPSVTPYLRVNTQRRCTWNEKLGRKLRPRIGLVWSGSATNRNDHNRSIALNHLTRLLDLNYDFFSLQKEIRPNDKSHLLNSKIVSFAGDLKDFSDTAALIAEMDLVISVDTSVAHLAGALGKPVWILLPFVPDFRWLLDREDSPWYPSARLLRQHQPGDWDSVIARVEKELKYLFL